MLPQWIIEKKRNGLVLSTEEIHNFIAGFTEGTIPEYQMSALAMAIYFQGMNQQETSDLTIAMMESGKVIDPARIPGVKVDKHSTGGIGDKISIPLAPLVAACGATVPMISGRGLGITGGTLDKLESIHGYRVGLSEEEYYRTLELCGCAMIGQTAEICPADKKLYALRDVTATVPSIPLIVSSIMSKKLAEGIDALILDVKCGAGAFMKDIDEARKLARALVATGESLGRKTTALITDMNQPLGRNIGNALEITEAIEILKGKGPADVRELTIELASRMLLLVDICSDLNEAKEKCSAELSSGHAFEKFQAMVKLHGGDLDRELPVACHTKPFEANKNGILSRVDAERIGRACLLLGAGRIQTTDEIDHSVGISKLKKVGEGINVGEPFCILHYNDKAKEVEASKLLAKAFTISTEEVKPPELIREIVTC